MNLAPDWGGEEVLTPLGEQPFSERSMDTSIASMRKRGNMLRENNCLMALSTKLLWKLNAAVTSQFERVVFSVLNSFDEDYESFCRNPDFQ